MAPSNPDMSGPPADYLSRIQTRLARYQSYPAEARRAGEEGVVVLRFVIGRNGVVRSSRIERSSGHASLDEAAARLIERASPLPPLPDTVAGERLEIVIPLRYRLR